eukprot:SAG31_NODE_29250_length_398_cov_1.033445_1_plen_110_part_10
MGACKFWTIDRRTGRLSSGDGSLYEIAHKALQDDVPERYDGAVAKQDYHHVAYLPNGSVAAAGSTGSITLFRGKLAFKEIPAHTSMCRCLCVSKQGNKSVLLSAGGDGKV